MSKQNDDSWKVNYSMPTSAVDRLIALGLTEYEATAYLVLLEEQPLTAPQLSECSGIPLSRVFSVLTNLEDRGAVESSNGTGPRGYFAVPAEEFLDRIRRDYREKLAELRQNLSAFH
jgi:sugar-specific transcriptional regulator TrmB